MKDVETIARAMVSERHRLRQVMSDSIDKSFLKNKNCCCHLRCYFFDTPVKVSERCLLL